MSLNKPTRVSLLQAFSEVTQKFILPGMSKGDIDFLLHEKNIFVDLAYRVSHGRITSEPVIVTGARRHGFFKILKDPDVYATLNIKLFMDYHGTISLFDANAIMSDGSIPSRFSRFRDLDFIRVYFNQYAQMFVQSCTNIADLDREYDEVFCRQMEAAKTAALELQKKLQRRKEKAALPEMQAKKIESNRKAGIKVMQNYMTLHHGAQNLEAPDLVTFVSALDKFVSSKPQAVEILRFLEKNLYRLADMTVEDMQKAIDQSIVETITKS